VLQPPRPAHGAPALRPGISTGAHGARAQEGHRVTGPDEMLRAFVSRLSRLSTATASCTFWVSEGEKTPQGVGSGSGAGVPVLGACEESGQGGGASGCLLPTAEAHAVPPGSPARRSSASSHGWLLAGCLCASGAGGASERGRSTSWSRAHMHARVRTSAQERIQRVGSTRTLQQSESHRCLAQVCGREHTQSSDQAQTRPQQWLGDCENHQQVRPCPHTRMCPRACLRACVHTCALHPAPPTPSGLARHPLPARAIAHRPLLYMLSQSLHARRGTAFEHACLSKCRQPLCDPLTHD